MTMGFYCRLISGLVVIFTIYLLISALGASDGDWVFVLSLLVNFITVFVVGWTAGNRAEKCARAREE